MSLFYLLLCRGFMKSRYFIIFMCWLCPVFLYAGGALRSSFNSFEQKQISSWFDFIQKDVSKRQDLTADTNYIYLLLHNYYNLSNEYMQQTQQDIKNHFAGSPPQFLLRVKGVAFLDSKGECYLYTSRLISRCGLEANVMVGHLANALHSNAFNASTFEGAVSDMDWEVEMYDPNWVWMGVPRGCEVPGSCVLGTCFRLQQFFIFGTVAAPLAALGMYIMGVSLGPVGMAAISLSGLASILVTTELCNN